MLNPVLRREMRTILRTWRTFAVVTFYVLCMAAVAGLYLAAGAQSRGADGFNPQSATTLYALLSGFQLGLVLLIVPALTGGAISGERERQTLDLMLVTKMSTRSVVLGKLLSSVTVVVLMIAASMPVYSILLFYGGVSLLDLAGMLLYTVCVALWAGSVAMYLSVKFKKTVAAIVVAYVIIIFITLGTFIAAAIAGQLYYMTVRIRTTAAVGTTIIPMPEYILQHAMFLILSINPFIAFMAILESQLGGFDYSITYVLNLQVDYEHQSFIVLAVNLLFILGLAVLLNLRSAALLKPVRKSKRYK